MFDSDGFTALVMYALVSLQFLHVNSAIQFIRETVYVCVCKRER